MTCQGISISNDTRRKSAWASVSQFPSEVWSFPPVLVSKAWQLLKCTTSPPQCYYMKVYETAGKGKFHFGSFNDVSSSCLVWLTWGRVKLSLTCISSLALCQLVLQFTTSHDLPIGIYRGNLPAQKALSQWLMSTWWRTTWSLSLWT